MPIHEIKTKMIETSKVKLTVKVPHVSHANAQIIARDVRFALENCGKLNLLDEFAEVLRVEYEEVLVEEVED